MVSSFIVLTLKESYPMSLRKRKIPFGIYIYIYIYIYLCVLFFFFLLVGPGFEVRASDLQIRHSTASVTLLDHFALAIFLRTI
jgi:hypothetical protein